MLNLCAAFQILMYLKLGIETDHLMYMYSIICIRSSTVMR